MSNVPHCPKWKHATQKEKIACQVEDVGPYAILLFCHVSREQKCEDEARGQAEDLSYKDYEARIVKPYLVFFQLRSRSSVKCMISAD